MCGIIGYIGPKVVKDVLIRGLEYLEYRGYDSSGIAVLDNGDLDLRKDINLIGKKKVRISVF